MQVDLNIKLRPHQLQAHRTEQRFETLVWHRRAGKTFYVIAKMLARALKSKRKDHRAYYIAPTFTQAKAIAFDYLTNFSTGIPGTAINQAELRIDYFNGSRIQLLGAERYDSLRGRYADDVVLDETAHIPSAAWTQVISPMLSDRIGRATFIGTPNGRMNLLFDLWEQMEAMNDARRLMLRCTDTDVLDKGEVDRMRRTMRPEEFEQELLCSWNAALRGAFYAPEMSKVEATGRITDVSYDRALPVTVALDLGFSDTMVAIFAQQAGTEHRIIDCKAYEQTAIPEMIADWKNLPFPIDLVILPHDAKVRELGTGLSRQEVFHSLGCNTHICPNQSIHEGIAQVRDFLAHAWFDKETCKTLIEALLNYRSAYDEVRNVHSTTPIHDWSSHYADAMRYLVLGRPNRGLHYGPTPSLRGGIYA